MKTKQKQSKLSGRQVRYLRGLGHHLKPLLMLGREGLNENVKTAADEILSAHELVKIKIGNGCPFDRREAAVMVAERTGAEIVQILGKTVLLFRANPDRSEDQRISLPK
jgi:RNA-binding protein